MRNASLIVLLIGVAACGRAPAATPDLAIRPGSGPARSGGAVRDAGGAPDVPTQSSESAATTASPSPADVGPTPPDDLGAWEKLGPPRAGEWRAVHPDDGASDFEDYVDSDPVRADERRSVLAFLPAGPFRDEERAAFEAAVAFTGIWFDLPVRTLEPVELTDDPTQFRVRGSGDEASRQYRTTWFLNALLPDRVPKDAVVLLGVTTADLYPNASWNFVFGEAHLRRRIGVYSLARYFPASWTSPLADDDRRLALLRTLKVVTHEAGHTFGLEHCVTWACTMNGSNSLPETDGQPLGLCPECLRKLAWNRGLDVRARYRKIAEFLDAHGLAAEAAWHRDRGSRCR